MQTIAAGALGPLSCVNLHRQDLDRAFLRLYFTKPRQHEPCMQHSLDGDCSCLPVRCQGPGQGVRTPQRCTRPGWRRPGCGTAGAPWPGAASRRRSASRSTPAPGPTPCPCASRKKDLHHHSLHFPPPACPTGRCPVQAPTSCMKRLCDRHGQVGHSGCKRKGSDGQHPLPSSAKLPAATAQVAEDAGRRWCIA